MLVAAMTGAARQAHRRIATRTLGMLSVQALNAVSPLLFEATELASFGLLGNKLAAVINGGTAPTYGSTVIGGERWAEPILKDIDNLLRACAELGLTERDAPAWPGRGPFTEYEAARGTHAALLGAGVQQLDCEFLKATD